MEGTKNPKDKPIGFIRKFVSNKLALRGGFGILGGIIFTTLLTVPKQAHAFFHLDLLARMTSLILGWVGLWLTFLTLIINGILTAISFFMKYVVDWVINLALTMPYTSGSIFVSAWPVLRDLANMALILILVGIGIGTMLSLGNRKSFLDKSRLPMFILVAVLINFTPVITGIIIDFSNIVANVFWQAAQNVPDAFLGKGPFDGQNADWQLLQDIVKDIVGNNFDSAKLFGVIISNAASIALNLVLIFSFLLLIALFLGRILALMLLVILSPIAFLGLIWSGGKIKSSLWNKWWHNFIQWSIIVIPLLFFLWLAGVFVSAADDVCTTEEFKLAVGGDLADVTDDLSSTTYVCQATQLLFAAGTLMFGVVVSFNSSAMGAKVITKRAQATAKWSKKKAREKSALYTRRAGAPMARDATQKLANTRVGRNKVLGAPLRGLARTTQKQVAQLDQEVKKYEKEHKNATSFEQIRADLYAGGDRGLSAMRVASDKFTKELAKEMEGSEKLQAQLRQYRTRSSIRQDKLTEDIDKRLPHLASGNKEILEKSIKNASQKDLQKLPVEALRDTNVIKEIQKQGKESTNFLRNVLSDTEKAGAYNQGVKVIGLQELRGLDKKKREDMFGTSLSGEILKDPELLTKLFDYREASGNASLFERNRRSNPQIAALLKSRQRKEKDRKKNIEDLLADAGLDLDDITREEDEKEESDSS